MTTEQLQTIAARGAYPGPKGPTQIVETHISWVLLTPAYAFKIKKPLQLSFLDFSTLEQRHYYCEQEVVLNRRLAPNMYLGVLSVQLDESGAPCIGSDQPSGQPLDYAVWMHRLEESRQMDRLLAQHAVERAEVEALAEQLAQFHRKHVLTPVDAPGETFEEYCADFEDLFTQAPAASRLFGSEAIERFDTWRRYARQFLRAHQHRLDERARCGFWVDGHGDLHARNIFLLPSGPVVFDCIEFSAHLRRLDVLNELAFLAMDLEARGHAPLAQAFMSAYQRHWPCIEGAEDEQIFCYFKNYRANVRLKIALIQWAQSPNPQAEQTARQYWSLINP